MSLYRAPLIVVACSLAVLCCACNIRPPGDHVTLDGEFLVDRRLQAVTAAPPEALAALQATRSNLAAAGVSFDDVETSPDGEHIIVETESSGAWLVENWRAGGGALRKLGEPVRASFAGGRLAVAELFEPFSWKRASEPTLWTIHGARLIEAPGGLRYLTTSESLWANVVEWWTITVGKLDQSEPPTRLKHAGQATSQLPVVIIDDSMILASVIKSGDKKLVYEVSLWSSAGAMLDRMSDTLLLAAGQGGSTIIADSEQSGRSRYVRLKVEEGRIVVAEALRLSTSWWLPISVSPSGRYLLCRSTSMAHRYPGDSWIEYMIFSLDEQRIALRGLPRVYWLTGAP